jgi:hypothetical protein
MRGLILSKEGGKIAQGYFLSIHFQRTAQGFAGSLFNKGACPLNTVDKGHIHSELPASYLEKHKRLHILPPAEWPQNYRGAKTLYFWFLVV